MIVGKEREEKDREMNLAAKETLVVTGDGEKKRERERERESHPERGRLTASAKDKKMLRMRSRCKEEELPERLFHCWHQSWEETMQRESAAP